MMPTDDTNVFGQLKSPTDSAAAICTNIPDLVVRLEYIKELYSNVVNFTKEDLDRVLERHKAGQEYIKTVENMIQNS